MFFFFFFFCVGLRDLHKLFFYYFYVGLVGIMRACSCFFVCVCFVG